MRRWTLRAIVAVGIMLGLWHIRLALEAIFVFRAHEPISSWLAIGLGPAFTLLGVVFAAVRNTAGGVALIVLGVTSFAVFAAAGGAPDAVPRYLAMFTVPTILVGALFVVVGRGALAGSRTYAP